MTEPTDTQERTLTELMHGDPSTVMVTTMIGREHTSRPVTCAEVLDHRLSFLVSREAAWVQAIAAAAAIVHVTRADDPNSVYLSLNGAASVDTDLAEITRMWNPAARAWFDGPDDPDIAIVHFDVSAGEYWDGPGGRVGRAVALLRAALTGDGDSLGTRGRVVGDGTTPIELDGIVPHRIPPDAG